MKIKAEVIKFTKEPNRNGRLYTTEALDIILNTWKDKSSIVYNPSGSWNGEPPINICGNVTNAFLNDDCTIGITGELFDDHQDTKYIKKVIKSGKKLYLTVSGYGCLSFKDNKTVEDYELNHFMITPDCAFDVKSIEVIKK